MIKRFAFCPVAEIHEMCRLVDEMRVTAEALAGGKIPSDGYTLGELHDYAASLVEGQRGSLGRTVAGSFSVAPDDDGMPSDARVHFIFHPTYLAVATLTRVRTAFPELAGAIPGFDNALRAGMMFCTHRRLRGHGYEDEVEDSLADLALGDVHGFLSRHPAFCRALLRVLDEATGRKTR